MPPSSFLFHWSTPRPFQLLWKRTDIDSQNFLLQRGAACIYYYADNCRGSTYFWLADAFGLIACIESLFPTERSFWQIDDASCQKNTWNSSKKYDRWSETYSSNGGKTETNFGPDSDVSQLDPDIIIETDLSIHIGPLVQLDVVLNDVQVEICGTPRHNPNRKSTEYVIQLVSLLFNAKSSGLKSILSHTRTIGREISLRDYRAIFSR